MNTGTLKTLLYQFLLGSMIFYIITKILTGIETSGQLTHWLMAYAVFFGGNLLVPYLIRFLTIPKNFLTFWLINTTASTGAFYAMSLFVPGISFGETLIDPVSMGIISVNPYTLSSIMTMVLAGIIAGLFGATFFWLDSE